MTAAPRLDTAGPAAYKTLITLGAQCEEAAKGAGLPPLLIELVRIRVSQINGCAFCLRMHVRDALGHGETSDRLAVLAAWRETGYFSSEERAALALAESTTLMATVDGARRPDDADDVLTGAQVAAVRWLAIAMSAFNRLAITSHYDVSP